MLKFLFISRHAPNPDQVRLAAEQGVELIHAGDLDAFSVSLNDDIDALETRYMPDERDELGELPMADGIVCVHPLIAVEAIRLGFAVGSFRNTNRAPVGAKPDFSTDLFVVRRA